jgi:hypothetical protein
LFQLGVFFLDRPVNNRLHYGLVVLFSSFDTTSDLLFILSSVFFSRALYGFSWNFFFLPSLQFCWITVSKLKSLAQTLSLRERKEIPWRKMCITFFRLKIFEMKDGYPHLFKKKMFCFDDIGGHAIRWLFFLAGTFLCFSFQVMWIMIWIFIHSGFYASMIFAGYFLHASKLNQNHKTRKRWFGWFLKANAYELLVQSIPEEEEIDVESSNSAVVGELILESIPQLCVVLINGSHMGGLTAVQILAISGSGLIIFSCLFKFGYWSLWMGVPLANIPFSGRPEEKYVSHSSFKVRLDTHFNSSKQIVPIEELDKDKEKGKKKASTIKVVPTISSDVAINISQNKDTSMNDVENQVSTTNVATVKKEEKDVIIPTIAPKVPTRSFLDRATSFPVISPHFQMVPKVVPNEEKVKNKKVVDKKMEETSSPVIQKLQEESADCGDEKRAMMKEQLSVEKDEDDNLKSKEEIESLSSLEDKSVIKREDVPSETFSPSKTSLSLKQCVDIIREQLHIEETGIGDVIKIALKDFSSPELTDKCDKQRTLLHKTHVIITEGLGMSLNEKSV